MSSAVYPGERRVHGRGGRTSEVRDGAVGAAGECASPAARLERPVDATCP